MAAAKGSDGISVCTLLATQRWGRGEGEERGEGEGLLPEASKLRAWSPGGKITSHVVKLCSGHPSNPLVVFVFFSFCMGVRAERKPEAAPRRSVRVPL